MTDTTTPNEQFVRKAKGYPGRDQLDQASMRFRRAVTRLHREGLKDPVTAAKLGPIITEAVAALDSLAQRAQKAENESARNRAMLAREQEKLERVLRKGARQGSPRAAELLRSFTTRREGRPGDDATR